MGLQKRQLHQMTEAGVLVFLTLFKQHPELIQVFPEIRGDEPGSINEAGLYKHGIQLVAKLDAISAGMSDMVMYCERLYELIRCAFLLCACCVPAVGPKSIYVTDLGR